MHMYFRRIAVAVPAFYFFVWFWIQMSVQYDVYDAYCVCARARHVLYRVHALNRVRNKQE